MDSIMVCLTLTLRRNARLNPCAAACLFLRPVRAAPGIRALAHEAPEQLAEVRLVGHATQGRNLAERFTAAQHEALSAIHAPAHHIRVGRVAQALLEGAA